MTSTIVIECNAALTRALRLRGDRVDGLWFGPARGDEADDAEPSRSDRYYGRVVDYSKDGGAAYVDLGGGRTGFLPVGTDKPAQGAIIEIEVKTAARREKAARLKIVGAALHHAAPGPVADPRDAALQAVSLLGPHADKIFCNDPAAANVLRAEYSEIDIEIESITASIFAKAGGDDTVEAAFAERLRLPGGGAITIAETDALTAIDIDSSDGDAASSGRLRAKIAMTATTEIARQIKLRSLGGQIVIDFPDLNQRRHDDLNDVIREMFPDIRRAGWTKTGMFVFEAPRRGASLLERWTEPTPDHPVAGRRFTNEWRARSAMTALEIELRRAPSARLALHAEPACCAYLKTRPIWRRRLEERYGARFEIIEDNELRGRAYDIR